MRKFRVRNGIIGFAIVSLLVVISATSAPVPAPSQLASWGEWRVAEEENRLDRIDQMVLNGVKVLYSGGHGSGVLFVRGNEVYVVTAAHVVRDRRQAPFGPFGFLPKKMIPSSVLAKKTYGTRSIWIHRQRQSVNVYTTDVYSAKLIAVDGPTDAAILRINNATPENFPGLRGAIFDLRNNKTLRRGMKTIHVGNFGDSIEAVTEGVISNPQQPLKNGPLPLPDFRVIQTTNMCAPGSSGGGVYLEGNGKCIGILVRTTWMPGDSLIIPIYEIDQWLNGESKELGLLLEQP